MSLTLFNTFSRRKERFEPIDPKRVTMYVCGPTVYSYAHIGNARPPVVFDTLRRVLERRFGEVVYARNITDVDDKIMAAAQQQNCAIETITEKFTRIYREDTGALGVKTPTIEPHATEHIGEMIDMMRTLIEGGNAYAAEGHVLFNVASYEGYGELSRRSLDEMLAGARVEVAPYKKNPGDFVLWKPSTPEQVGWDSPWGRGRPGWHLECSAMAKKHLGETIDIHGGGIDLAFPHHENERAQSTCAHGGKPFARFWVHNGFLTMNQDKMSKSLGNVVTVHELLEHWPGEALRLTLLSAQYRQPLDWSEDAVGESKRRLDRMYRALRELEDVAVDPAVDAPEAFVAALEDDLNTPQALSVMAEVVGQANNATETADRTKLKSQLLACGELLGILQHPPAGWLRGECGGSPSDIDPAQIEALIVERNQARAERNFQRADEIRDQLKAQGIELNDGAEGTSWNVIS